MFNIYYLNENKAFELAMLLNNRVQKESQKEKTNENSAKGGGNVDTQNMKSIPLLNKILPSGSLSGDLSHTGTKKIIDNFQIVQTKSTIFNSIVQKSIEKKDLNKLSTGSLIKISDLNLEITNIQEGIATKMMLNGVLNNMEFEGLDMGKTLEVLLKDNAYLISGSRDSDNIMFNIPMQVEAELENGYSISDLELGTFTVVGIYRGIFSEEIINSKINQINFLDTMNESTSQKSLVESEKDKPKKKSNNTREVHYVDLIGIIQEVKFLK
ncbi:hypothetical protein [Vagococcus fluvialis]|uniref:hypothetical protein n=1 Tax=Vagococcus fluvialis TaxID=2738 RepID=UPI003B5BB1A9